MNENVKIFLAVPSHIQNHSQLPINAHAVLFSSQGLVDPFIITSTYTLIIMAAKVWFRCYTAETEVRCFL